jgi:hypothetical protein
VILDEAVAQRGPCEEVDCDGVFGAGLCEATNIIISRVDLRERNTILPRPQPLRNLIQLLLRGIKIILFKVSSSSLKPFVISTPSTA